MKIREGKTLVEEESCLEESCFSLTVIVPFIELCLAQ